MPRVLCMEPNCNEMVELPMGDAPMAVTEEYLPPDREVAVVCRRGHVSWYVVSL